jgi:hypothetical protein
MLLLVGGLGCWMLVAATLPFFLGQWPSACPRSTCQRITANSGSAPDSAEQFARERARGRRISKSSALGCPRATRPHDRALAEAG